MKKILLFSLVCFVFFSCKKENVATSEYSDSISGVRIRYIISVVDGSTVSTKSEAAIQSAVVCMVVNDSVYETQVDKNGIAVFNNLFAGNAIVQVKCEGYTTANFVVDLRAKPDVSNIYDATNCRLVSDIISIFPTAGESLANVSGRIYADLDLTSAGDELVPNSLNVRAFVNPEDLYKFVEHEGSGNILDLSYDGFLVSTASQSGTYSLSLPASANNLQYVISADDFEFQRQINSTETERTVYSFINDTILVQTSGNYILDLNFEIE